MNLRTVLIAGTLVFIQAMIVFGQDNDQDLRNYVMDEIVVVADRTHNLISQSTNAATILTSEKIQQLPATNIAEALKFIPGFVFVEGSNSQNLPIAVIRGFFGGGETEYVLLTINGIPANDLRKGLAQWNQVPLSSVERIEVLRGGGSAVYGDAAIGAVINIVTKSIADSKSLSASLMTGQDNLRSLDISAGRQLGRHFLNLGVLGNRSDGFRSHSTAEEYFFKGEDEIGSQISRPLYFNWNYRRLKNQYPGPLTPEQISENREQNNPLCAADNRDYNLYELGGGYHDLFKKNNDLILDFGFRGASQDQTRTYIVTPGFGDTQFYDEDNLSFWIRNQLGHRVGSHLLLLGIDADYGHYTGKYYTGVSRDSMLSDGNGNRLKLGEYAELQSALSSRLRTTLGMRFDYIDDRFHDATQNMISTDFNRLTPRVGVNFAYSKSDNKTGNIYLSWNQSFKTPTLDQLFDQRRVASYQFSNYHLRPERSNGFEAGIYQKIGLLDQKLYGELALSAYRIDLKDEIDFNLSTFQYDNILASRHDGIEVSLNFHFYSMLSLYNSMIYSKATFRNGENFGKQLKSIPEKSFSNILDIHCIPNLGLSISQNYMGNSYLDDQNIYVLPSNYTFDSKVQYLFSQFQIFLNVKNIFDSNYNSSGYVLYDPYQMTTVQLLYPAPGRTIQGGVTYSF